MTKGHFLSNSNSLVIILLWFFTLVKILSAHEVFYNVEYKEYKRPPKTRYMEFDVSTCSSTVHLFIYLFLTLHLLLNTMENITTNLLQCIFGSQLRLPCCHDSAHIQQRDAFKISVCQQNGITLMVVPYWWDKKEESLAQSLHKCRPDIPIDPELLVGNEIGNARAETASGTISSRST